MFDERQDACQRNQERENGKNGSNQMESIPSEFILLPGLRCDLCRELAQIQDIQSIVEGDIAQTGNPKCADQVHEGCSQEQPKGKSRLKVLNGTRCQQDETPEKDQKKRWVQNGPIDGLHAFQIHLIWNALGAGNH